MISNSREIYSELSCFSHVHVHVHVQSLWDPMDCSPPGSSIHGILRARILEWVTIPSSKRYSWPRDWTCTSCSFWIAGRSFITEPPGKPIGYIGSQNIQSYTGEKSFSPSPTKKKKGGGQTKEEKICDKHNQLELKSVSEKETSNVSPFTVWNLNLHP